MKKLKKIVTLFFEKAGFEHKNVGKKCRQEVKKKAIRYENLCKKLGLIQELRIFEMLSNEVYRNTMSSDGQDIIALKASDFKRGGYFVEIGVLDGIHKSNCYLLEKMYEWQGVLIEANPIWYQDIEKNRSSVLVKKGVYSKTSKMKMIMTDNEAAALTDSIQDDGISRNGGEIEVFVDTLTNIMADANSPKEIDYLSMDIEGAEFEAIKSIDWDSYRIHFVTIEHNFTKQKDLILEFMEAKGYTAILPDFSRNEFWFVQKDSCFLNEGVDES